MPEPSKEAMEKAITNCNACAAMVYASRECVNVASCAHSIVSSFPQRRKKPLRRKDS